MEVLMARKRLGKKRCKRLICRTRRVGRPRKAASKRLKQCRKMLLRRNPDRNDILEMIHNILNQGVEVRDILYAVAVLINDEEALSTLSPEKRRKLVVRLASTAKFAQEIERSMKKSMLARAKRAGDRRKLEGEEEEEFVEPGFISRKTDRAIDRLKRRPSEKTVRAIDRLKHLRSEEFGEFEDDESWDDEEDVLLFKDNNL